MINTQPDQRTSPAVKQTADWYIRNADYIIEYAQSRSNKSITRKFIDAANNRISDDQFKHVIKQYGLDDPTEKDIMAKIRNVDFITPIKEKYMGEFINMFQSYQVYNNDPDTVLKRNSDIADKVVDIVVQEVINKLNEQQAQAQQAGQEDQGIQTNADSVPSKDIEKDIEIAIASWNDTEAIETQHHLDFLNDLIDARSKYIQAYWYWFVCEEVYTYRELYKGDVHMEVISPLEYYRVSGGSKYVEDDPMGVRIYKLNVHDLIDRFRDDLTAADIDYIKSSYRIGETSITPVQALQSLDDYSARKNIFDHSDSRVIDPNGDNTIEVCHYVWKAQIKQGILNYIGLDGITHQTVVTEDYELDTKVGDIDIEWEWVNQVWEGYRFGKSQEGIYTKPKPIPVQRESFNNASVCKSPYNGVTGMLFENDRNPVPYRLLDYTILYRIYTLQEERAINRFKSLLLFPETILADTDQMTTAQRLNAATRDGFLPFDDANAGANSLQSIREVANTSLINYLQMLSGKKQELKSEAFEVANMNDARFGNIAPRAGKGVTEYAFSQAMTGSVLSLEVFNLFRERDYIANLDYSKIAWFDGKQGSYVDPNSGAIRTVSVNGSQSLCRNVGIFVRSSRDIEDQLNELRSIAFNMSQNGNGEFALEAITNKNPLDLKAKIKDIIDAQKDFELQMKQYDQQAQAQQAQYLAEQSAQEHQQKLEIEQVKGQSYIEVARIEQETAIQTTAMKMQVDTDGNGYISKDEADSGYNDYSDVVAPTKSPLTY